MSNIGLGLNKFKYKKNLVLNVVTQGPWKTFDWTLNPLNEKIKIIGDKSLSKEIFKELLNLYRTSVQNSKQIRNFQFILMVQINQDQ